METRECSAKEFKEEKGVEQSSVEGIRKPKGAQEYKIDSTKTRSTAHHQKILAKVSWKNWNSVEKMAHIVCSL